MKAAVRRSVALIIAGFMLASCGGEPKVTLHPADELIPTYDAIESPIVVEKGEIQTDHRLSAYIADTQDSSRSLSGTGIFVDRSPYVEISRLDKDRFLVLDEKNFELMIFSEEGAPTDTVATKGGDPGNVTHASGLDVFDDLAHVSARDNRIETYECADGCTYADTRTLAFSPYGVAAFGERVLAPGFTHDADKADGGFLDDVVQVLRGEKVTGSFMKPYGSSAPLVAYKLNNGHVAALDGFAVFAFENLPYIYVFQHGKIHQIYEIEDFHLPEREGRSGPGVRDAISVPMSRVWSMIQRVKRTGDGGVVVTVETVEWDKRLVRGDSPRRSVQERQADYYAINVNDEAASYLGTLSTGDVPTPRLIPTTGTPVVVHDGEVFHF